MRLGAFALLAWIASTGCAISVRARAGAIVDDRGLGVQVGLTMGLGIANKEETRALVLSGGGVAGTKPTIGTESAVDVVVLPERRHRPQLGARFGLGGSVLVQGSPTVAGLRVAPLYMPHRAHRNHRDHPLIHAIGVEAMVGMTWYEPDGGGESSSLAGGLSLTYDLLAVIDFKMLP